MSLSGKKPGFVLKNRIWSFMEGGEGGLQDSKNGPLMSSFGTQ